MPGEQATLQLLRAASHASGQRPAKIAERNQNLPSFLSAGIPGDRRGRVARKSVAISPSNVNDGDDLITINERDQ